ncbi:glycosyl transferase [candidate division LCP-89 bacterium B3_LCP]|uniref:Glycosyl transferase n=1 Tax=candidate division LCP-89 bacterium B3_LCP TaxID=2012998 RepID=A0A532V2Z3_UNCL8|nr:MAG: glycosyl transferase [candidate division LCP-89 bacterium B3_LCP]
MKLVVQIPCLNEEEHLPGTIADVPREIPGVDEVQILVIDDGSIDDTSGVAQRSGADRIVRFRKKHGLATAFKTGLDIALAMGADIIVNTDADNQYKGSDIPRLIEPILNGKANMVIGTRNISAIGDFSVLKKFLQKLGSAVMRIVSQTRIPDATSGFRAYDRRAALNLNVISIFTYTLETIIQAGKKNFAIHHVPVEVNERRRESRLFRSTPIYIKRSLATILRIFVTYEPLRAFFYLGTLIFSLGLLLGMRFLYFFLSVEGPTGHIQSLIFMSVLLFIGFMLFMIGLVADLISANRRLMEDAILRMKRLELQMDTRNKVSDGTEILP